MRRTTQGFCPTSILRKTSTVVMTLVILSFGITSINAAAYTVANLNPGGPGSLRRAIVDANATPDDDEIFVNVTGTINLAGTELTIANNGSLTINGPGADQLSITGGNLSRVFNINIGADVVIDGVEILQGNVVNAMVTTGGGIYNQGTLTLTNSVVTRNTAVSGGGISNGGSLSVFCSTISGNIATTGAGGGIRSTGAWVLNSSVVSGNSAGLSGGGISTTIVANINNSTISGNTAPLGGGISASTILINTVILKGVTITGNSNVGLNVLGTVEVGNTIIAENGEVVGGILLPADIAVGPNGDLVSLGHNLFGNGDSLVTGTLAPGDQAGTTLDPLDPVLGPLQNYGGPTETHALLGGSPAIDAGDNSISGATFDQRGSGFPRIVNLVVDIGAFEVIDDPDGDGVPDFFDICADTGVPEDRPPGLLKNRYFLNDAGEFEDGNGEMAAIDIVDAGGCSGAQIVDEMGLGIGHKRHGISKGALQRWVSTVP